MSTWARGATVLIVDRSERVRAGVRRELERLGWTIVEADSLRQARDLLTASMGSVALVITEDVLPDATGADVLLVAGELAPWAARLLITSGVLENARVGVADTVLVRPWTDGELSRVAEGLIFAPDLRLPRKRS